jgi:hypothetical protein
VGLAAALVDRGRTVRQVPAGPPVEGTTPYRPEFGEWQRVRIRADAPGGEGATGATYRSDAQPTLLYLSGGRDLGLRAEDRVEVDSPELGHRTWQVVGDPKPLRKKRRVIAYRAQLRLVDERAPSDQPGGW